MEAYSHLQYQIYIHNTLLQQYLIYYTIKLPAITLCQWKKVLYVVMTNISTFARVDNFSIKSSNNFFPDGKRCNLSQSTTLQRSEQRITSSLCFVWRERKTNKQTPFSFFNIHLLRKWHFNPPVLFKMSNCQKVDIVTGYNSTYKGRECV